LTRVGPAGEITRSRSPIHADELGFDAAGALWLKGRARIARLTPEEIPAPCDEREPAVRVERFRDGMRISARSLRRRGGFTVRVREPVDLAATVEYNDGAGHIDYGDDLDRVVGAAHGAKVRYLIPRDRLRRLERALAKGDRPSVRLIGVARDIEGNTGVASVRVRVTR
jgi:hypothetical protein